MLKAELIKRTAYVSGKSQETVRTVLDAMLGVVKKAVSEGRPVMLAGVGKLYVAQRGEKRARNIRTGEVVIVPPRKVVLLQPSDALTRSANSEQ